MPVGTKATVKTLDPDEVRALGAQIVLGNTYHLLLPARRRADRRARRAAPLHGLGRADPDRLGRVPGVLAARHDRCASTTRASRSARVYDGAPARFTPELAARDPGGARLRHRHVLRPGAAAGAAARRARGGGAADDGVGGAAEQAPRAPGQLLFGIAQGGVDPELRRRSIEEIAELDFDGNAIGGLTGRLFCDRQSRKLR